MDYGKVLSAKAQKLKPSGIRRFFDMLDEMKDVTSLTVGQPDFDTPWHIRDAAIESLKAGKTYYTSNSGLIELRSEISAYLSRRFGLDYSPKNEILVTVGGSEAIDLAFRAVLNPGDEVITMDPAFVCYDPLVTMAGGVPVPVCTKLEDNFKITVQTIRDAITPRTKMIVLPFPNNPTGAVMDREDLEEIADLIRDTDILVLSDEIYAELTYGGKHISFATLPDMWERTITVSGLSKAYAMTGWRIGYVCAPAPITYEMTKIHQFGIMCASTTSQIAAIEAFRNGDEDIEYMVEQYDGRRRLILDGLRKIGISCFEPRGAFYVFPDLRPFGMSSNTFCERLLYEQKVAIVPGNAFGECGEGFARISYAYSVMHIQKALHAIEVFVDKL